MIIHIDGKECQCEKGEYILTVAQRNGIEIPTLCHHEAITGQACCRLCIVEVTEKTRSRIVVSCVYPVTDEITVATDSKKVQRERGLILSLLAKRAPESEEIKELCKKYSAPDIDRFVQLDNEKCVMCGLCAKACAELSVGAISTVNRGVTKEVSTPYHEESTVCVGCGSCARICPTGAIELVETENTRTIWGKSFDLVKCENCGAVIGTKEELEKAAKESGLEVDTLCADCRKEAMAQVLKDTYSYN
ncbi:MAG: (2Fe-2S)-binding protein [Clostridiales bacterium]|nr:(2Fe-2S)-binding protein [Candidatus Crickella equi]